MPAPQLLRYPAIFRNLLSRVVARSALTDVTDASRFKRFLAGVAKEVDGIYYQLVRMTDVWSLDRATGDDLEHRVADLQPLGLVRLGVRRSSGNLVFSRRAVTSDVRVIPAGSIGLTDRGQAYRSLREVEITPTSVVQIAGHVTGQDSIPVPAVAVTPGVAGNCITGSVRRLQGSIVGVDSVTNVSPFVNGRDRESDDQLRTRAKAYIVSLARCGYSALEFAVIGLTDGSREVVYSRALPNPARRGDVWLFIDDGNGTAESTESVTNELVTAGLLGPPADSAVGGEEYLTLASSPVRLESPYQIRQNGTALVNDLTVFLSPTDGVLRFVPALTLADVIRADYVKYTGLIPVVQQVINGIRGNTDFPGWGAAGVRTRVRAPRVVVPDFAGTLYLAAGVNRDDAILNATNATLATVNSGGISDDAVLAQIIERVMEQPGMRDFVLLNPLENVTALDDEIIRITAENVSYS